MLTRLHVDGFKNLIDVDVRFGPFTCVAGPNGVGKSNLFDAITFLSKLASSSLIDAAKSVRDEGGRQGDIRTLFHRVGEDRLDRMSFVAEMIVPPEDEDDLGQKAKATITFLRYSLTLGYRENDDDLSSAGLEIVAEELVHINRSEAHKHLPFIRGRSSSWIQSTVQGQRRHGAFISTEGDGADRVIKLHQDGGSRGKPVPRLAKDLTRTVLSASDAESPTVLTAKKEMESWRLLQLEPSALRRPDSFDSSSHMSVDGSYLPAMLYRLAHPNGHSRSSTQDREAAAQRLYAQVANRLALLIEDVAELWVDKDLRREVLSLYVRSRDGTPHPARGLSDGTLRFIALAALELDPAARGLICLEEPENGIHPTRIPAMLQLLQDIATDVEERVDADNPLRQVIVNTHSPVIVQEVPEDCLLVAEMQEAMRSELRFQKACFSCLPGTWRQKGAQGANTVSKGRLMEYLNPVPAPGEENEPRDPRRRRRVRDRVDAHPMLFDIGSQGE